MGFPQPKLPKALWHFYKTFPEVQDEYKGVKVLWLHTTPNMKLNTKKKMVKTLDDLKGMKIGISGQTGVKVGKALGLSPVTVPTPDLYEAADKGVIGCAAGTARFRPLKSTMTDVTGRPLFVIMNQKKWDSLRLMCRRCLRELCDGCNFGRVTSLAAATAGSARIEFTLPIRGRWRRPTGHKEYAADGRRKSGAKGLGVEEACKTLKCPKVLREKRMPCL
jgi:hypothetical protein